MDGKTRHISVPPCADLPAPDAPSQGGATQWGKLERFFDLSLDLLCVARTDGYFRRVNGAWTRTLGWSEDELCAHPFLSFVHPDDVARTARNLERHRNRQPVRRFENRYRCRDGSYRWLQWTSMAEADGTVYGIARDVTERRQIEEALRLSEQRFRDFAESASDWLWETGPDMRLTYISEHSRQVAAPDRQLLLGETGGLLADGRADAATQARYAEAVRQRRPFRDLVYFRHCPEGSTRWLSISGKPRFARGGGFLGYRGTATDITGRRLAEEARQRAEQALRDSHQELEQRVRRRTKELKIRKDALRLRERRFRDLAEAASDWFWETDAELRFTWFSSNMEMTLGVSPEDFIGKTREDISAGQIDPEVWQEHLATLRNRKRFRDFKYLLQGPNGLRWVRISGFPAYDDDGAFLGYRGTGRDITADVEAYRAASAIKDRFLHAIENLPDGLSFWDAEDRFVLCNTIYRRHAGGAAHLLMPGCRFEDFIRRSVELGEISEAIGREEAWLAERMRWHRAPSDAFEIFRNDRWMLIRETKSPDGGTLTSTTDITELKHREAELDRAKELAERANRAKSEFLANMSHELRTPLNAIIGFSETIMSELFGPVGQSIYAEYGKDIHDSGLHLLKLINELLDLSKIEAGKLDLHDSMLTFAELVPGVVRLVEPEIVKKRLHLSVDLPMDLPRLRADELAVKQMLLNLLSNAVKFTPEDGTVTVRAVAGQGGFRIAISDTGIGIAPENLAKVVTPFSREKNPLVDTAEGTGLGLPIVKSLIELHGGQLQLDSTPGVGTVVTLHFPPERLVSTD